MTIRPTFVSHKIKQHLKPCEVKRSIVNQQSLIYQFKCDLCDAGYVGYTQRHLHQLVDEHKNMSSSIGKHFCLKHYVPNDLTRKKCKNKFDCLNYEMFINELRPSLNVCAVTQFLQKFFTVFLPLVFTSNIHDHWTFKYFKFNTSLFSFLLYWCQIRALELLLFLYHTWSMWISEFHWSLGGISLTVR